MKNVFKVLIIFVIFSCQSSIWMIPANKSYVEPYTGDDRGIHHDCKYSNNNKQDDIKNWSSSKTVCWYLHLTKGEYDIDLEALLPRGEKSEFMFNINSINKNHNNLFKEFKYNISGTGKFNKKNICKITINTEAFYRLELKPISKSSDYYGTIRNLIFKNNKGEGKVRYANWLSSPSVHLAYSPENNKKEDYNWLYGEIMVPVGMDPIQTFYMCQGFFRGYFGIQVNSLSERRVLFSVWDTSKEGFDRKNVKKDNLVQLLDKGAEVVGGSFGNEGTGGQTFLHYNWKTGQPIKFLMNTRKVKGNKMVISAWFKHNESEGWKYMASWLAPKESRYFNGFYSFIENFGTTVGQKQRKAFYYNMWGYSLNSNKWVEFNSARMTHTDGDKNSRSDFSGGVSKDFPERFFMSSGGYFEPNENKLSTSKATNIKPNIKLENFKSRVDQAFINNLKHK